MVARHIRVKVNQTTSRVPYHPTTDSSTYAHSLRINRTHMQRADRRRENDHEGGLHWDNSLEDVPENEMLVPDLLYSHRNTQRTPQGSSQNTEHLQRISGSPVVIQARFRRHKFVPRPQTLSGPSLNDDRVVPYAFNLQPSNQMQRNYHWSSWLLDILNLCNPLLEIK